MKRRILVFLALLYGYVGLLFLLYLIIGFPFFLSILAASWAPNIAAFITIGLVYRERGGIKRLLKRWIQIRVPAASYGLVLAYVLVIAAAIGLYAFAGGEIKLAPGFSFSNIALMIPMLLVTGATGEELGWRGFLLDELQRRHSGLASALIIAPFWLIFHIPLWLRPEFGYAAIPFLAFGISTVGLSVSMAYIVNRSGGSLFIASLAHFVANFCLGFVPQLGIDPGRFFYFYAALNVLYAILIVGFAGRRLGKVYN